MARPLRSAYERAKPRLVVDENGCWIWPGAMTYRDGYGLVGERVGDQWTTRTVHRVIWEGERGPIPEGLHLDHLCGVRLCANPDHLEPVTQAENNRRMGGEVCKHGHPRIGSNVKFDKNGTRLCVPCLRDNAKRHRDKRRAMLHSGPPS